VIGIALKVFNKVLAGAGWFLGIFNKSLALKCFDRVLHSDPYNYGALRSVTDVYKKTGQCEVAIDYMGNLLKSHPDNGLAWHYKGVNLERMGKKEDADECYREALSWYEKDLQKNPLNAVTWSNGGIVLNNLGKYDEALPYFDKSLELNPKYVNALKYKGLALINLEKNEEAIKCFDKALVEKAGDAETWLVKVGH